MRVLFIEPFDAGSHAGFRRVLSARLAAEHGVEVVALAMPGRHWKWRMRGAAPYLAEQHDAALRGRYDLLFASSYLALAELVGLYPGLGAVPRVLYFHENQAAYPTRGAHSGPRDEHFAFTQIVSALAATRCVFNSVHNRDSFLDASAALLRRMPDARLTGWRERVEACSEVLGVPLELPEPGPAALAPRAPAADGPVVLWNHRWEHDKNPTECFDALVDLADAGVPFRLVVCGEAFAEVPPAMALARARLADRVEHWGHVADRAQYLELLGRADIAVSTAVHEFFGVAMLEATWCGARPLVPDRLAYPELFPAEYRYRDFAPALRRLCVEGAAGRETLRADRRELVEPYRAARLVPRYRALFDAVCSPSSGSSR